jgi:hypothetical protein
MEAVRRRGARHGNVMRSAADAAADAQTVMDSQCGGQKLDLSQMFGRWRGVIESQKTAGQDEQQRQGGLVSLPAWK